MCREHCLDLSDLPPPEPLQRALEAAAELREGEFLRLRLPREPLLLYPQLERRGFRYLACGGRDPACELYVWRDRDQAAERACRVAAGGGGR